jgi:predicted Zn-dependent protease with MMP-like domain
VADPTTPLMPVPPRHGSGRDRRGRGARGPLTLPGPLTPAAPDPRPTRREDFDDLVVAVVERLTRRWTAELADVEFGTEDVPQLPADWHEPIPFGSLVRATATTPARIVLFRRPIEMRVSSRRELAALVREVVVEHVADLLGRDPDDVDP